VAPFAHAMTLRMITRLAMAALALVTLIAAGALAWTTTALHQLTTSMEPSVESIEGGRQDRAPRGA
jgi:hypothetical protein